jgi:phosphatidylglycerophosphatase A
VSDAAPVSPRASPTFGFLFSHPAHFVALGFGAGLAPFAPGTFGTLVAIPIAVLFRKYFSDAAFGISILAFALVGVWVTDVTGRHLGVADHPAIVWDEVVAFLLVVYFVGDDALLVGVAFFLFRFFDIAKPPPIRQLDRAFKNGFGVMVDDLAAAGYTLLALALWRNLFG